MKIKLLCFIMLIPFALNAQQPDTSHSGVADQYLYFGLTSSFVSLSTSEVFGGEAFGRSDKINTLSSLGSQIRYRALWQIAHSGTSFYMGGAVLYYNTRFNLNNTTVFSGGGSAILETDQIITEFNSKSLCANILLGFQFAIGDKRNLYFHIGAEPQLRLLTLSNNTYQETQTTYDTNGNVTGIGYANGSDSARFPQATLYGIIGLGQKIRASHPHPLVIEFNLTRDFFRLRMPDDALLRSYALELTIGYKLCR